MTAFRTYAIGPLMAATLFAGVGFAVAGGPATPDRGAGASGAGDGSGMGQDTSESGKPKGPGDRPTSRVTGEDQKGSSSDGPASPANCDDGAPPIAGSCAR